MARRASRWITTSEAAQRLGVKRATLYAYVSRGLLHSERRPGQQESLFDRAEIDAVASTTRASGAAQPLLRFRSVATSVSSQLDGDLLYRGVPLAEVVDGAVLRRGGRARARFDIRLEREPARPGDPAQRHTASSAARAAPARRHAAPRRPRIPSPSTPTRIEPDRRVVAADPAGAGGLRPGSGARRASGGPVPSLLVAALRRAPATRADGELMRVLLTTLLDHGLTASTIAARVAASTRAGIHDCLCAGLAVMSGPLHGAAPVAARALLDDPRRRPRSRRGGDAQPTAACPASATSSTPTATRAPSSSWPLCGGGAARPGCVDASRSCPTLVAAHSGLLPNIDLASAAVDARAGPAGRRRRSRLPGRPLLWAHRARARGVRRDAAPVARQGGHRLTRTAPARGGGPAERPSGIRHDP